MGIAFKVEKEKTQTTHYYFVATYEKGLGYNKQFDNGKPVNAYSIASSKTWRIWEKAVGIDVNIDGYGIGIQGGGDNSVSVHLKNNSFEYGHNTLGRVYLKHSYSVDGDNYGYSKFSVNWPEVAVVVVGVLYAPELVVSMVTGVVAYK